MHAVEKEDAVSAAAEEALPRLELFLGTVSEYQLSSVVEFNSLPASGEKKKRLHVLLFGAMIVYLMTLNREKLDTGFPVVKQEFKGRPRALEYLSGIITDLYVDWHKFQGTENRVHACQQILLSKNNSIHRIFRFCTVLSGGLLGYATARTDSIDVCLCCERLINSVFFALPEPLLRAAT